MPFTPASFFNSSSSSDTSAELNEFRRNPRSNNGAASGQQREQRQILVSSAEIGRLFDMIAELNRTVKKQEEALNRMAVEQAKCHQETADLREEIASWNDGNGEEDRGGHYGPLPKEVKEDVRTLHNKQDAANQYRGDEKIDTPHNCRVRHFLVETILKDSNFDKATIRRAATRYYETKRQRHLDSLPERRDAAEKKQKEKALTSRRRRLYVQRMKVASEEEKRMLEGITHNFMSDEEDGDENDVWVVRSPSWRSNQLNTILARLQERASSQETTSRHPKYKRVRGRPSARPSPSNAPAWALNNTATNQEEPEEPAEEPEETMEQEEQEPEDSDLEPAGIEPPLAAQCSTPHNKRPSAPKLTTNNDEHDDDEMMCVRRKKKSGKRKTRL